MGETMMMKDNTIFNENIDMQQLMNITGQNAMLLNGVSKQMGILATTIDGIREDMSGLTGRMDILEQKEEITTTQVEEINNLARKRVYEILGYSKDDHAKYFRTFIMRLYSDTRHYAGLGSSVARTRKCDFQRCIDYMEAWIPVNGCSGLKGEIDEKAKSKRIAKELGYDKID